MAEERSTGPVVVKHHWAALTLQVLAGGFLLPLVFEFLLSRLNDQSFDLGRALVAFTVIAVGMGLLALGAAAAPRSITVERLRAGFLMAAGLGVATHGFLVALVPEMFTAEEVTDIVGMIALLAGVGVLSVGVFYLVTDFRRPAGAAGSAGSADPQRPRWSRTPFDEAAIDVDRVRGEFDLDTHEKIVELCRVALNRERLHYLAFYEEGRRVSHVDGLGALGPLSAGLRHDQRRKLYDERGLRLVRLAEELSAEFHDLRTGRMIRLVLDVRQGAIYIYEIDADQGRYLIGVTLDQREVTRADFELARLSEQIQDALGLTPTSQLPLN